MKTTDDERLDAAAKQTVEHMEKLLLSRDRWRKVALLCATLLAAFVVMFIAQCAKLP
jgi:hypothetical protein